MHAHTLSFLVHRNSSWNRATAEKATQKKRNRRHPKTFPPNNHITSLSSHLDELAGLDALLESATHLMGGEVERRVGCSNMLLDRLDAGPVALLQGFDGLEHHLRCDKRMGNAQRYGNQATFNCTPKIRERTPNIQKLLCGAIQKLKMGFFPGTRNGKQK